MNRVLLLAASLSALMMAASGCRSFIQVDARLDRVEASMNSDPGQALCIIDSIDTRMLFTRSRRARYSLLKTMSLDKNFIDTTDTDIIMPAVDYFRRHGTPDDKMRAYYYLGAVFANAGKSRQAMTCFMMADDETEYVNDYYTAGLVKARIADVFSYDYNSTSELKYIQDACRFAELANDTIGRWYYKGRLAACFYNNGIQCRSDSLYEEILSGPILDTIIYVNQLTAYAKTLVFRDKINPVKSVELLRRAMPLSERELDDSDYGVYAYALEMAGYPSSVDSICKLICVPDIFKYHCCSV